MWKGAVDVIPENLRGKVPPKYPKYKRWGDKEPEKGHDVQKQWQIEPFKGKIKPFKEWKKFQQIMNWSDFCAAVNVGKPLDEDGEVRQAVSFVDKVVYACGIIAGLLNGPAFLLMCDLSSAGDTFEFQNLSMNKQFRQFPCGY